MGLEKKILGKLSPLNKSLALGRPHGTQLLAASVCVIHTRNSGWRVQCVFYFFVIILLSI